MEIIIIKKTSFDVVNIKNVTSITLNASSHQWTIVADSTTVYSSNDYDVRIIG